MPKAIFKTPDNTIHKVYLSGNGTWEIHGYDKKRNYIGVVTYGTIRELPTIYDVISHIKGSNTSMSNMTEVEFIQEGEQK